jgi:hypothetical protein
MEHMFQSTGSRKGPGKSHADIHRLPTPSGLFYASYQNVSDNRYHMSESWVLTQHPTVLSGRQSCVQLDGAKAPGSLNNVEK